MFRRVEHPRAKDVRSGAPKPVNGGSFAAAAPNSEAGDEVGASLTESEPTVLMTMTAAGRGQVCTACGDVAAHRVEYGSPPWAQNHSCAQHSPHLPGHGQC